MLKLIRFFNIEISERANFYTRHLDFEQDISIKDGTGYPKPGLFFDKSDPKKIFKTRSKSDPGIFLNPSHP